MSSKINIKTFDLENTILSVDLSTALRNLLYFFIENVKSAKTVLYIYDESDKLLSSELVYINGTILIGDEEIFVSSINKDEKSLVILNKKMIIKPTELYVPMKYNKTIYGLLLVDRSLDKKTFSKREVTFIKNIADLAAKGIYQNRILKDRDNKIKQLNALLDISLVLNTKKKKTILDSIGKALIKYGKFDRVRIYIKDRLDKYVCTVYKGIIGGRNNYSKRYFDITAFNRKYITDIYYIMNLEKDENMPLGFIEVDNIISQVRFIDEQLNFLKIIGTQLSITLKNIALVERLKKTSITDPLTNAYNYRYLVSYISKEIKRSERFDQKFSLLLFDIDDFKKINDKYGHQKGDEVLTKLIKYLRGISREIDVISRYGGDEFIIVASNTDKENAVKFGKKILMFLPAVQYKDGNKKIKISMGISTFPDDGKEIPELIKAADRKLYQAKRAGKHRVQG
ncbi:MAG: GGDEF domain-containing protein [Spirochaetes bacterium]|nr:GGDEF domain-containing protein [Spirochaetota bacterium]